MGSERLIRQGSHRFRNGQWLDRSDKDGLKAKRRRKTEGGMGGKTWE